MATTSEEPSTDPVSIRQHGDKMPAALHGKNDAEKSMDNELAEKGQGFHRGVASRVDACISPADGSDCKGFIRFADIGPNDVLFGRGKPIYDNIGNIAFRRLAETRKAEYLDAKTNKEKNQIKNRIAKEIVDHIRCKVDPPGRFLTAVEISVAEAMGLSDDEKMWCLVDDETVLEKAKQTLRQQKKSGGGEQQKRPARKRFEPSASEESRRSGDRSMMPAVANIISSTQLSSISSTDTGEINVDESKEWMPSVENPEALTVRENDMSLDMKHMVGFERSAVATAGGLGVARVAEEMFSPSQLHHIQANVTVHSARLMTADRGTATSGLMQQTESKREDGSDKRGLDERSSLLETVRFASELVKKTREVQDAGAVVYGSNIGEDSSHLTGERIRRDLVSLGCDLYRHFSGVDPFDESRDGTSVGEEARPFLEESSVAEVMQVMKKKERQSKSQKYVWLRDLGFPVSLCILVSSLLDAEDESAASRYETVDEVEEDLSLMIADPERYLFDAGAERLRGQLVFPDDRLYGREHHVSHMMGLFNGVTGSINGPCEMLLISGYSGTGKSALVEQLRGPLLQKSGHFVSGKFDQLGQAQPMSVIFDALNEFCNTIAEGNDDMLNQTRTAIQEALGSNWNVLTDLIPNLSKLIGEPATEAVQVGGREALNRFLFYFRLFVQGISSPSHPVILFLDDLQWADSSSLNLISTIVCDPEITSLLVVGCFRDNEVGEGHPLIEAAGSLALAGVSISNIKLENIDRRSVNALVSDALHLSPRVTWPLGDIVFNKTSGNPLFAVQFLRSLYDDHLLWYSACSRRWEWDVEAIESKDVADNVVDLMTKKILKLDSEVQWLLKVAACLGSRCDPSMLKLLGSDYPSNEWDTVFLLDICVREGLMCKLGSVYKFSHDQIQQAAYSLIAVSEREALHLHIGRSLWKRASKEELEKLIFAIVDQLQRGSSLISNHDEKVEVARLCLTAGEKAMSSSAFSQASIYLLQGCAFLQESDWVSHYDLSLRLFSCCAEAQYAIGNADGLVISVNPIFAHGRCLQDKLWAISNHLRSVGGEGKFVDALGFGLSILADLGESFPSEADKEAVELELVETRKLSKGTSVDDILEKGGMTDENKVAAMKLLMVLSRYAYQVNQYLCSMMAFRMIQLTMCHGTCPETPFAFAAFGAILCTLGELEQGAQYGKLALSLLDTLEAKEHLARVYVVVYPLIKIFSEPLQATLPSLMHGCEAGMSTGDIEYGLACARNYCSFGIQCGSKLEPLADKAHMYIQRMKDYKQSSIGMLTLPILQAIYNLIGDSDDPTVLTGKAMDQEELLKSAHEKQYMKAVSMAAWMRLWLAYLFRRYDVAAEMAEQCQKMSKTEPLRAEKVVHQTFYIGLIAIERVRGGEEEWRNIACESLEKMMAWARNLAWNFQHKLDLLNAEMAYLNGDNDGAAEAYDDAIRVAGEHGFIHERALACERASIFYSETLGASFATEYFERAKKHYLEWGATRKARDMCV